MPFHLQISTPPGHGRPLPARRRWQSPLAIQLAALLLAVGLLLPDDPARADSNRVVTDNVSARILVEQDPIVPGTPVDLALQFEIRPHWHTYWRNPGDSGEPPRITWNLPEGVQVGPIRWPWPEVIRVGPLANYGYEGEVAHLMALEVPADWPVGTPVELGAEITWLVCEEHCIPESGHFRLRLETAASAGPTDPARAAWFTAARDRLPEPNTVAAHLAREGDQLHLQVPAAALPATPTEVRFFSGEWGLIEHASEQPWRLDDKHLTLDLTPGPAATAPATGLLVVRHDAGTLALEIDASGAAPVLAGPDLAGADAGLGLPLALAFALLGGIVLNLMPCVFPVLAIKAFSLARQGGAPVRTRALHGIAYTAGVLTFFALVAVLLLALRAGGAAIGWGFQLQSPVFVALMAYLFLVIGLSLAGAVTLGTGLMGLGSQTPTRGHTGDFMTGALAALVAAPCTAPFMGVALGYAITLPWPLALLIMLTLGLGLALPFLLLALLPQLGRWLPRPGPWMETLKQFLAFPMFATAAWLVWVIAVQTGPAGVAAVLSGMVVLALGLWLLERAPRDGSAVRDRGMRALGLTTLLIALGLPLGMAAVGEPPAAGAGDPRSTGTQLQAEAFSADRLSAAVAAGQPVFVNMSAAWCITCLVNERVALDRRAVAAGFAAQEVLYLKGDWTNRDPAITEYLASYGRNGVPLYVFYAPGHTPQVLPQVLTEALVLATIDVAAASQPTPEPAAAML
ncbi:MAG: protein-disulfide reductase [Chromatiaceae bacterium]|nr:MAG: protein-disulfide reductase [Chromatiaceae bacterium]